MFFSYSVVEMTMSLTSMGCSYLSQLKRDGVTLDPDSSMFKEIDPDSGEFTNKTFKFDSELGKHWQFAAQANGLKGSFSG